jgi:hypothetical protein
MQKIRESLTILLLGLLPFHAFLVTVGTHLIVGPGSAPLTMLVLWKEAVLAIILVIAFLEWIKKPMIKLDTIDWLIVGMIALSILVTANTHGDWRLYLIGFKYDFVPLVVFLALRRVAWSEQFMNRLLKVILVVAGIIAAYGIVTLYLPQQFFSWFGYGDLHSLYQPNGPLAAFQQIGGSGIRRIQSTMSGPNQLGIWLLIPLSIVLVRQKSIGQWSLAVGVFVLVAMFLTLSRSALLAAGVMVGVMLWRQLPRKKFFQFSGVLFCLFFVVTIAGFLFAPDVFVRSISTRDHINRPMEAIRLIIQHPFGMGLGTAGPASNRVSDTCVYLREGSDPSWAEVHPNLCVFVGKMQVQPVGGVCSCPFLPENWYLQMGVEMGVVGFALFVTLTIVLITQLGGLVGLSFLSVSFAALFLHSWEDSAVAYSIWILIACYSAQLDFLRSPPHRVQE